MAEYTPPSGPNPGQSVPPQAGAGAPPWGAPPRERPHFEGVPSDVPGKKIAAGVLAIVLGWLGIHKFVLGYTGTGILMLLLSLLTFGIGASILWIIGIIEGILYLTKTDEDFYRTYIVGKKNWF
jgi:TM2 domain-containing membrane protein YozV